MTDQAPDIGAEVASTIKIGKALPTTSSSEAKVGEASLAVPSSAGRVHEPHATRHHVHPITPEEASRTLSDRKTRDGLDHQAALKIAEELRKFHAHEESPLGHEQRTHETDNPTYVSEDPDVKSATGSSAAWNSHPGRPLPSQRMRPGRTRPHKIGKS